MENIKSFELDHDIMIPGFYLIGEANNVYTYDLRFKVPNGGDYLNNAAIHSIEHLFATVVRNSDIKNNVVYFGPMGCRTGFYLLLLGIELKEAKEITINCMKDCLNLDFVPGTEKIQCGNYLEHNLEDAQNEIRKYLKILVN